jgi:hypothetical protein
MLESLRFENLCRLRLRRPGALGLRSRKRRSGTLCYPAAVLIMSLCGGCQTVKPWQRESLAARIMQPDRDPMGDALKEHVFFSREAASGGRSVGGGGCGCN